MSADVPAHPAQWAELVTTALLGTDRRGPDDLTDPDPAAALLLQAARHRVVSLLAEPVGVEPVGVETVVPEVGPAHVVPEAPPAADRLLGDLLRTPDPALISTWLATCAQHDRTVAAIRWTRLARLAARTAAYDRRALGAALGPRGRWFLRQNPEWRRLAADVAPPAEPPEPSATPTAGLTASDVLTEPESIFAAARPWGPELVSAAYAVLGGEGEVPPTRGFATRLGVALPVEHYPTIARAGEYYVLSPDASPARRRTIRDRFVALELAAYARAAIDHAFTQAGPDRSETDDPGFPRAEIPHV